MRKLVYEKNRHWFHGDMFERLFLAGLPIEWFIGPLLPGLHRSLPGTTNSKEEGGLKDSKQEQRKRQEQKQRSELILNAACCWPGYNSKQLMILPNGLVGIFIEPSRDMLTKLSETKSSVRIVSVRKEGGGLLGLERCASAYTDTAISCLLTHDLHEGSYRNSRQPEFTFIRSNCCNAVYSLETN